MSPTRKADDDTPTGPAVPVLHVNLAAALAAFQAELPDIAKNARGQARGGQTKYADLAEVSSKVMPLLGKHGLSFSARPTLTDDGRFVLAYSLRHESGNGEDAGMYPLPNAGMQEMGSAITYARRYTLMAVTGVAPDEDDDGHAAQRAHAEQRAQRQDRPQGGRNGAQNGQERRNAPARDEQPAEPPSVPSDADRARAALRAHCESHGYDGAKVAKKYASMHEGRTLKTEDEAVRITAFTKLLDGMPEAELRPVAATNGAAQ